MESRVFEQSPLAAVVAPEDGETCLCGRPLAHSDEWDCSGLLGPETRYLRGNLDAATLRQLARGNHAGLATAARRVLEERGLAV